MSEINFNVEDLETINLSMDVGIKEIYPLLENLTVIPTKEQQVFNHENSYGYDKVTVNAISLQDKSITINENGTHSIVADNEYDGLNQVNVTVDAIEDLTEELTTYDTQLTTQETTIEDILEALKGKGVDITVQELITSFISSIDDTGGQYCTRLPDGITSIGAHSFYNCYYLALTSLPESVINIKYNAFYGCSDLALTKLPNNLKSIDTSAFRNCSKLAIKTIPSGVTELTSGVFRGCTGLSEITCLGNITELESSCFFDCSNLSKFVMPNITSVPTLSYTNCFGYTPIADGTGYIYVPDDLVESFKTANNWSTYANQIKGISELEEV